MNDKTKIWLIKEGEPLPIDNNATVIRVGLMAEKLSEFGYDVTWWTSSFNHGKKEYYCDGYKELQINENQQLILLHSKDTYKKNTSLKRIKYHKNLAKQFKLKLKEKEKPDIIICSYPTIQFAKVATDYGKKNNIPVILDIRDLWPDTYERIFPSKFRWMAKIALFPMKKQVSRVFKKAKGIIGVVPPFVSWGVKYAKREKNQFDQCFFISYQKSQMESDISDKQKWFWEKYGVTENTWNICFAGTLSNNSSDLITVIRAVNKISTNYPDIRLVICGDGDAKEEYKKEAENNCKVVFPGWLGKEELHSLMKISKCGVYPYKNTFDFTNGFGNKIIQYMSEKLPVISSLKGFSKTYIDRYSMGVIYEEGDVDDCAIQIERMYNDPQTLNVMKNNSYTRFLEDFESNVVNMKIEKYIQSILMQKTQKGEEKRNE